MAVATSQALEQLLGFLRSDPDNLALRIDVAGAALQDGQFDLVGELASEYRAAHGEATTLANLAGVAAMAEGRYGEAEDLFRRSLAIDSTSPALRYNLAWALAAQHVWREAASVLDERTASETPAAALLRLQVLHQLGELEEALAWGRRWSTLGKADAAFLSTLSAVALDAEDLTFAESLALRAPEAPEALATLGMLELRRGATDRAAATFADALTSNPNSVRAWLGNGLVALSRDEFATAARRFDEVASFYQRHVGSWVAAGWAHLLAGDLSDARSRFETAVDVDGAFGEAQGGLAVVALMQGDRETGRRRATIAQRLDPAGFASALARSLLLRTEGAPDAADQLLNAVLDSAAEPGGETLRQLVTRHLHDRR